MDTLVLWVAQEILKSLLQTLIQKLSSLVWSLRFTFLPNKMLLARVKFRQVCVLFQLLFVMSSRLYAGSVGPFDFNRYIFIFKLFWVCASEIFVFNKQPQSKHCYFELLKRLHFLQIINFLYYFYIAYGRPTVHSRLHKFANSILW